MTQLSSISSFTRIIRSNFRLIKYKWNIITNNFSKDDDKLYTDLMEMLKQLNIFIELIATSLLTLEEKPQA